MRIIQFLLPAAVAACAFALTPDAHASVRFCFQHDSEYIDAGLHKTPSCTVTNSCEDHWSWNQTRPMRGMWVWIQKIGGSGAVVPTVESGTWAGCTEPLSLGNGDVGYYDVTAFSMASYDGEFVMVTDMAGNVGSVVDTVFHHGFSNPTFNLATADEQTFARFNVLDAATKVIEEVPETPDLTIRVANTTDCASSCYFQGTNEVQISTAADHHRSKLAISHEIGHAVMRSVRSENWTPSCNVVGTGHMFLSYETSGCAFVEGFAHFFAASVWNDEDESDCWLQWGSDAVNCELGQPDYPLRALETLYDNWNARGVEVDWMRALWDYVQDGYPWSSPGFSGLLDLIAAMPDWATQSAFPSSVAGAGDLGQAQLSRWLGDASWNGIDH